MKHRALLAAAPLAAALLLASPAPAYDDDTLGICFNTFVLFTGPTSGFCRQDKDCAPIPAPLVQICEKNNICVDNRGFPTGPTCASAEECGVGQSCRILGECVDDLEGVETGITCRIQADCPPGESCTLNEELGFFSYDFGARICSWPGDSAELVLRNLCDPERLNDPATQTLDLELTCSESVRLCDRWARNFRQCNDTAINQERSVLIEEARFLGENEPTRPVGEPRELQREGKSRVVDERNDNRDSNRTAEDLERKGDGSFCSREVLVGSPPSCIGCDQLEGECLQLNSQPSILDTCVLDLCYDGAGEATNLFCQNNVCKIDQNPLTLRFNEITDINCRDVSDCAALSQFDDRPDECSQRAGANAFCQVLLDDVDATCGPPQP